ncbi:MAG TPA: LysR family transcriptional regulator [Aliidongia sp.]|uniref:LysR family transcriptional regulator n=1 Tax=Aliidongia sp. TaxID=1914230 RepID=UPI002DDCB057|nr:LysR family transcriptional regulator [Aliidongia sp.]HEV2678569.1 LysR family transcriptional regulator [Aliidongia sp.]
MRGHQYAELRAFQTVVASGSFTRAAAELRISPSALSQIIRRLEARLGVTLLNRTTRSLWPSEAGARLLGRIGAAFDELDGAVEEAAGQRDRPRGIVRINAPRLVVTHYIAPMLAAFAVACPDVTVELLVDDGFADIVATGCDLGVRLGERLEKDMVALPLGPSFEMMAVASPEYLETRGVPTTPQELRRHDCINYRMPTEGGLYSWEFEKDGKSIAVAVEGTFITNDHGLMLQAALDGTGIAYLLDLQGRPPVEQGRLHRVLQDWSPRLPGFYLYRPGRRQDTPAVGAFIEMLRTCAGRSF